MPSLKLLGSVGEPINEEAWHWYHEQVGKKRCAIVDTWWQTENGGILLSGLGDLTPMKPAQAGLPLPGVRPILVDPQGNELKGEAEGHLCIDFPWPSIIRTTWGDHERCRLNYFAQYPGRYFTGDGAKRDKDGYFRIIGRVDDVINVSGHRIGTAEVENAIDEHPDIVESAVVGYPHDIKGQGIYAFVICDHERTDKEALRAEVIATVERVIGKVARPDKIQFVKGPAQNPQRQDHATHLAESRGRRDLEPRRYEHLAGSGGGGRDQAGGAVNACLRRHMDTFTAA
jgi:acetyl-CoA synthetase